MKLVTDSVEYIEDGPRIKAKVTCHLSVERDWVALQYFKQSEVTVTTCGTATCDARDTYDVNKGRAIARSKAFYKAYRRIDNIVCKRISQIYADLDYLEDHPLDMLGASMEQQAEGYRELTGITEESQFDYEGDRCMWLS